MDAAIWVQIQEEALSISNSAETQENDMNPTILPPAMSK